MTENAKADVVESMQSIKQMQQQLSDLTREREDMAREITDKWGSIVSEISEVTINPKKTDVYVNIFGVAWKPYYLIQAGGETIELAAFGAE